MRMCVRGSTALAALLILVGPDFAQQVPQEVDRAALRDLLIWTECVFTRVVEVLEIQAGGRFEW